MIGWLLLVLIQAGPAAVPPAAHDPVPVGSVTDWFGPDQYPPEALRQHKQGRVAVEVQVDATGRPVACAVTVSSGSEALDKGTCAVLLHAAFFQPATDAGGHPVAAPWRTAVRWVMPTTSIGPLDVAKGELSETSFQVDVAFGPGGVVTGCQVTGMTLPPGVPGPCQSYQLGRKGGPALTRNGKPIGGHMITEIRNRIEPDGE